MKERERESEREEGIKNTQMNNYYSYDSYDSPRELVPGEVDVGEERELGVEGDLNKGLGLEPEWAYNIVKTKCSPLRAPLRASRRA